MRLGLAMVPEGWRPLNGFRLNDLRKRVIAKSFHVRSYCYNRAMKPTFLLLVALAMTPPLMAAENGKKAHHSAKKNTEMKAESDAIDFKVTGPGGTVKSYRLEVPDTAGQPQKLDFKISQQAAALAAINWASGFYGATNLSANTVEWRTTHKNGQPLPFPYYLVNLTGKVGDTSQPLYAVVLENGELVRPVETSSTAAMPEKPKSHSKKS
jgi:hypothetical protein